MAARPGRADRPTTGPGQPRKDRRGPIASSTATRRTTRVDPEEASGGPGSRSRSKVTGRALILLLVVAVLGVSYASSIRAWVNQRNEQHALRAQIAVEKAQIERLRTAKARWNDPSYIEAQARLRF